MGCRLGTRSQGHGQTETEMWQLGTTEHFDRGHIHGLVEREGSLGVPCGRGCSTATWAWSAGAPWEGVPDGQPEHLPTSDFLCVLWC